MHEQRGPRSHLEVHLLFPPDTTLGATLIIAGLRPAGRVGTAEVWVTDTRQSRETER